MLSSIHRFPIYHFYFASFFIFVLLLGCTENTSSPADSIESHNLVARKAPSFEIKDPKLYYRRMEGMIDNKLPITAHIVRDENSFAFNYSYKKVGRVIETQLETELEENTVIKLSEYDPDKYSTLSGTFTGALLALDSIKGTWTSPKGKELSFVLGDSYPSGSIIFSPKSISNRVNANKEGQSLNLTASFPYFEAGFYPALAKEHNPLIEAQLIDFFSGLDYEADTSKKFYSINQAIDSSAAFYLALAQEEDEDGMWLNWAQEVDFDIFSNEKGILSYQLLFYEYTGGAHGNYWLNCYTLDTQTGKTLRLSDLFSKNYDATIRSIALQKLIAKYQGFAEDYETTSLEDLGFFISNDEYALTENFWICPAGITFVYDPYAIGPYVMGSVEIFVAFSEIQSVIKKNGPLDGYAVL